MPSATHSNAIASKLAPLRAHGGSRRTVGLDDAVLAQFADNAELGEAVDAAVAEYAEVKKHFADLLDLDEASQMQKLQAGFINFYQDDAVNPYVALAARGPWIVTLKGAVIHDSGGYGMLGFGHAPAQVIAAMAKPQAMANIMTPSISQLRLSTLLREAIGVERECPFTHFMCLNSGSESVTLAARIADANAKTMTDEGGKRAGHRIKRLVVKGGFHGRTDRPALYSNSTRKAYEQYLASYRGEDSVIVVEPYDMDALKQAFADADAKGWFIEAMFLEPVMGEGDPGRSVPVEFYKTARELTREHGSFLLVDSIQAGLRANGVLSIIDYPGFEGVEAPDMETYSKALNAGQYPLSVLAVNERAGNAYRKGLYGNTMTTNPRALDTACAVLEMVTPELRENIRARGAEALEKLEALKSELGGMITKVQGTGLLFSCELSDEFKCFGSNSTEEWLREHGIGVIHGGANSLRFTPTFTSTSAEIELLVNMVGRALREGPRASN
ncbi:aminotransferase class III-fold pyridoxal phosphate-dependent enzyme [Lysobacter ciconiae]|uniref:Aminotransferase class III-fold pyridoxal phosphate-dependent enzyme n=1 Tax=Novilysobacter ciconiae TaxID=2781022 RepID=A0A7S6UHM3_9GAMM|nr:aminotransferase class III-fold pyridoxal phosphate-dependent enzyme [Lysobacter ciconiae]QOW20379.1 aminotransferase class III-fold pyridoxal phosphate-dependent enzyme [Lysobacter ciconiae]